MNYPQDIKKLLDPNGVMSKDEYAKAYKSWWNKKKRDEKKAEQQQTTTPNPQSPINQTPRPEGRYKEGVAFAANIKEKPTGLSEPEVTTAVNRVSGVQEVPRTNTENIGDRILPKKRNYSDFYGDIKDVEKQREQFRQESRLKRGPYTRVEHGILGVVVERIRRQARNHFQGCRMDKEKGIMDCIEGCMFGQYYWVLKIESESHPDIDTLPVYEKKLELYGNPDVMKGIESWWYAGKRLLFICHKDAKGYRLIDWKEVPNN